MVFAPGTLIGRYRVQEIIGRGASSIVYRADDPAGRTVALKAVREELLAAAERSRTLARFVQEARVGRMLRHPHIVEMLDLGEHEGRPFMIMDLITGESFDERIRRCGPMPPEQACQIAAAILEALAFAHTSSIVHRDVKPANVVLRGTASTPVLMDFGIAHVEGSDLTQLGDLLGTPAYLAPEQLRGEPIDHRADIFAAAVLTYEACTGRRPFDGSLADVMRQICFDEPPLPSSIRPALRPLDAVMMRGLSKDPGTRFQDAAEFAAALRVMSFDDGPGVASIRPIETTMLERPSSAHIVAEFAGLLDETLRDGIDAAHANLIRQTIDRIEAQDVWKASIVAYDNGLKDLTKILLDIAPLPQRESDGQADWVPGMRLAHALLELAGHGPRGQEAAAAVHDLAEEVCTAVLAYRGDVAERLAVDEAPDVTLLAGELLRLDTIAFGLEELGAARERRQVDAASRLVAGQILRRCAAIMDAYAGSRDPLARFDIVNMLVSLEDLIAISSRLADDVPVAGERLDAVASRSVAAITGFLTSVSGLIAVSDELVFQALEAADEGSVRVLSGHLKQLRLIHRFGTRLSSRLFTAQLAALTEGIYGIFGRVTDHLIAGGGNSLLQHERISVVYEIVAEIGWSGLARQLLDTVRRSAVAGTAASGGGAG